MSKRLCLVVFLVSILVLGTSSIALAELLVWHQVVGGSTGGGGGFGRSSNVEVFPMIIFGDHLYAGTINEALGGEIWRYDGTNWEQVVGGGAGGGNGFGNPNNIGVFSLAALGSYLYAGTWNDTTGTEIWRSQNGTNWAKVVGTGLPGTNAPGFGYAANRAIFSFGSFGSAPQQLYAGTGNMGGAHIWRSSDGTTWAPVVGPAPATEPAGFDNVFNDDILCLAQFGNSLYATTWDGRTPGGGTEIWRTTNGADWSCAVGPGAPEIGKGFGNDRNVGSFDLTVFGGQLYAGTANIIDGAEIWRSTNGTSWARVGSGGLGDQTNRMIVPLEVLGDYLYAGTWNISEIITEPAFIEPMSTIMNGGGGSTGGQVWRSSNGTSWGLTNTKGFGDVNNNGVLSLATFGPSLYAGTDNGVTGAELWRTEGEIVRELPETGGDARRQAASNLFPLALLALAGLLYSTLGLTLLRLKTED